MKSMGYGTYRFCLGTVLARRYAPQYRDGICKSISNTSAKLAPNVVSIDLRTGCEHNRFPEPIHAILLAPQHNFFDSRRTLAGGFYCRRLE